MISINEFTRQVMAMRDEQKLIDPIDWNFVLTQAGYVPVSAQLRARREGERLSMIDWCTEQFGIDHYVWTGLNFWFETEQDAIMFALRYGRDN